MQDLLMISLTSAVVIALLLLLLPHTEKRYSAKWRTIIWIVLAIRLLVPYRVNLPSAPIQVPRIEDRPIVYTYETPSPTLPGAQTEEKQLCFCQKRKTQSALRFMT